MKKFNGLLLALSVLLLCSPVFAKDKAKVKFGFVGFKSVASGDGNSVAAVEQADRINITLGGAKGTVSGTLTVILPTNAVELLEKGTKLDITSTANEDVNQAVIVFQGQKTKINGLNTKTTGITSTDDTSATGTLTVVNYDSDTRELKFKLKAKASPWAKSTSNGNKDVSKAVPVRANVVVTLPELI